IYRDHRSENARKTFSSDVEPATSARLLAFYRFRSEHEDDRRTYRSAPCTHRRSSWWNGQSVEAISRRHGGGCCDRRARNNCPAVGGAPSLSSAREFYNERGVNRHRYLPNGGIPAG